MIGKILKEAREEKRISVDELAAAAKITRQTLWNIEKGKVDPKHSTLNSLAQALGLNPAIFFGNEVNCNLQKEAI